MTQGRYIEPVYRATSVFESPRFLYMIDDTTDTVIIGTPIAKYNVGIQMAGCRRKGAGASGDDMFVGGWGNWLAGNWNRSADALRRAD
jgi:hypothetical protein